MKKAKTGDAPRRVSRRYEYASEGPYWLSRRLNVMRDTLESRRSSTFLRDALIRGGIPVVKAVREYLAREVREMTPRQRNRLQRSLDRYEAEAS